ncbi:Fumarylacetoacetate (FAA) hydrolase family protein 3 [Burkholderiales bacterium]|nr:Fumarylacetoacetate (FAA) hydrolase family protein 3 [Burkholderiales bacterium]
MGYVFAAPGQAVVPVVGTTDLFPVHRIYCVGRNYAEHAREMGFSEREPPFFFAKPADAVLVIAEGAVGKLPYPPETSDLQYEVELVVALGRHGRANSAQEAAAFVWGYAVGVDLTRRDLQASLKKQGRPWEISKSFDLSAPISAIRAGRDAGRVDNGRIWLDVNGERRQESDVSKMIWGVNEIIEHLSRYFALAPGDLIFSGTPAGVGAVVPGDVLDGGVDGVGRLSLEIVSA